jgi:hypothetical protein
MAHLLWVIVTIGGHLEVANHKFIALFWLRSLSAFFPRFRGTEPGWVAVKLDMKPRFRYGVWFSQKSIANWGFNRYIVMDLCGIG